MSRVTFDRVSKRFDSFVAVDSFTLDIAQGELVALLGPSGCGKTTTLRMVAGLEQPSSGAILFDGAPVHHLPPQQRGVGLVFQNYALFMHMSVYDNIAFGLRIRRWPEAKVRQEVERLAEALELKDLLRLQASRLDLSSMQRVALARTLITQPRVLLLDEPFNNIRPGLREAMRTELRRLQQELKQTTIFVTHDQEEALALSDRIVVMRRGRIEQVGTPEELYHHPRNLFVATFLGAPGMSLLKCQVTYEGGLPVLQQGQWRLAIPGSLRDTIRDRTEVWVGIRPEAVRVGEGDLEAIVTMVQPLGAERLVILNLGGVTLQALTPASLRICTGERTRIELPQDQLRLFDVLTEEALDGKR